MSNKLITPKELFDFAANLQVPISADARDAAKYRWLLRLFAYLADAPAEQLDETIVKTMAKMPLEDV